MEINPQQVRSAEFKTVRKGVDPEEVRGFLNDVADELERAQNQSTAMEARARAAVARLQELSDGGAASPAEDRPIDVSADQSETISRTLLLAQRTADSLVTEAKTEAARVVREANDEAAATRDSTREMAATMLVEARVEARRAGELERVSAASEVDALIARRDFLEADVDQLEQFLVAQRSRLRDVAAEITAITDRVPSGLGDARRPLLSASDDDATGALEDSADEARTEDAAEYVPTDETPTAAASTAAADVIIVTDLDADQPASDGERADELQRDDDFRFSFDDEQR
jgi:DivIVA domain-containing protein